MGRFYDRKAWRVLRKQILHRDGYRCVRCSAYVGGKGDARIDHVEPLTMAPHRALDPSNLRTLCPTCDNRSHSEKASNNRHVRIDKIVFGNDESGMPLDAGHPWAAGQPSEGGRPKSAGIGRSNRMGLTKCNLRIINRLAQNAEIER
jgi:hypothetical protein